MIYIGKIKFEIYKYFFIILLLKMSVSQNMVVQYMMLLYPKNTNKVKMIQNIDNKIRYHKMYKNIENMKKMNNIKNNER